MRVSEKDSRLVIAVIEARLASERFPRKILQPLDGVPLLLHTMYRVASVPEIDMFLVATTPDTYYDREFSKQILSKTETADWIPPGDFPYRIAGQDVSKASVLASLDNQFGTDIWRRRLSRKFMGFTCFEDIDDEDVLSRVSRSLLKDDTGESIDKDTVVWPRPGGFGMPNLGGQDLYVRVTGDCPLWSPDIASYAIRQFDGKYHLVTTMTFWEHSPFMDGTDVEVAEIGAVHCMAGRKGWTPSNDSYADCVVDPRSPTRQFPLTKLYRRDVFADVIKGMGLERHGMGLELKISPRRKTLVETWRNSYDTHYPMVVPDGGKMKVSVDTPDDFKLVSRFYDYLYYQTDELSPEFGYRSGWRDLYVF